MKLSTLTLALAITLSGCGQNDSGGSEAASPAVDASKTSEAPEADLNPFVGTFHMACTNGIEITVVNTEIASQSQVTKCEGGAATKNSWYYEIAQDKGEGVYDVRITASDTTRTYEWVIKDDVMTMSNANVGFKAELKKVK